MRFQRDLEILIEVKYLFFPWSVLNLSAKGTNEHWLVFDSKCEISCASAPTEKKYFLWAPGQVKHSGLWRKATLKNQARNGMG